MLTPMDSPKKLFYVNLGLRSYRLVWDLQERLRIARQEDRVGDLLIFCEHRPVFTVGKQDCSGDWLSSDKTIAKEGIEVVRCNRGGRITYHGPGQLVAYFIVRIQNYRSGVREFVAAIEEISIGCLEKFGLSPTRKDDYPGIWLGDKKVVAIGFNVSKGVSMHGLAVNVNPDLSHYRHIVPCGIRDLGVTSLAREMTGRHPSIGTVRDKLIDNIVDVFGCGMVELPVQDFSGTLGETHRGNNSSGLTFLSGQLGLDS